MFLVERTLYRRDDRETYYTPLRLVFFFPPTPYAEPRQGMIIIPTRNAIAATRCNNERLRVTQKSKA